MRRVRRHTASTAASAGRCARSSCFHMWVLGRSSRVAWCQVLFRRSRCRPIFGSIPLETGSAIARSSGSPSPVCIWTIAFVISRSISRVPRRSSLSGGGSSAIPASLVPSDSNVTAPAYSRPGCPQIASALSLASRRMPSRSKVSRAVLQCRLRAPPCASKADSHSSIWRPSGTPSVQPAETSTSSGWATMRSAGVNRPPPVTSRSTSVP